MAKARKLPSGNWRIEPQADGHRASFTAPTKAEAELMASQWKLGIRQAASGSISLGRAMELYIEENDGVLSPSTIRGYHSIKKRLDGVQIINKNMATISASDLQRMVNQLSKRYSPKSVKNTYGLVSAVFAHIGILMPKGINIPTDPSKAYALPTEETLAGVLEAAKGTPMETAILLAAFGGLRRSEISALTSDDVDPKNSCIYVHSALVLDKDRQWQEKGTKTRSSTRTVMLPDFVMEHIAKIHGRICPLNPNAITDSWIHLRNKAGISTRFHDLRHFSASLMHAIGVPDQYIMSRHGWKTDHALKKIYRNELDDFTRAMNEKTNAYISERFS